MNKIVAIAFLLLLSATIMGQNRRTEYYAMTKIYRQNGKTETPASASGQFVTRVKQVCYDSNKNGATVNNGTLSLVNQQGNDSKYVGQSYFGYNCSYTFYDDKGILNIKADNGDVYVYRRTTPPAGRTTCSLIGNSNGNPSGGGYVEPVRSNTGNTQPQRQKTRHTCTVCKGTGEKIHIYYTDGTGRTKYCAKCGTTVDFGHQHQWCNTCKGQGYLEY